MDLDIPELEDFSEIISITKEKQQIKKNNDSVLTKSETIKDKSVPKSEFGGMKKGFLSNGFSEKKSKLNDNVPFLKANPAKAKSNLVFEEVQEKHKKNNWLTDDLLNTVADDNELTTWLSEPNTMSILTDFQLNPQAAMIKYKDDEQTQKMLLKFGHLLGNHLSQFESIHPPNRDPNDVIISAYEPNKAPVIRSELDNKVEKALSTAGVKDALLDPQIQTIIGLLRSDPAAGQRLIKEADRSTLEKLRLLVESGVLGMQQ